jgi:hypothetical protein
VATSAGELRETLIEAIAAVRAGTIDHNTAKSMAMLAAAVTANLIAEVAARREERGLDSDGNVALIGHTPLGENLAIGKR